MDLVEYSSPQRGRLYDFRRLGAYRGRIADGCNYQCLAGSAHYWSRHLAILLFLKMRAKGAASIVNSRSLLLAEIIFLHFFFLSFAIFLT